jgi:hypothetical protein
MFTSSITMRPSSSSKAKSRQEPIELLKIIELNGQTTLVSLATSLDVHFGSKVLTELAFKIV